jgi:hypothetical protein
MLRYIAVALPVAETCNSAPIAGIDDIGTLITTNLLEINANSRNHAS